jgi:siroheme decarboxylase
MDELNKELLDVLQDRFPLSRRPYAEVGAELGITEAEVLERISALKDDGIIRRIGPILSADALGYVSALFAVRTAPGKEKKTAEAINRYPGVTHNYGRTGPFTLWCTLTAKSPAALDDAVETLKRETRPEAVVMLPKIKTYKLKATFRARD